MLFPKLNKLNLKFLGVFFFVFMLFVSFFVSANFAFAQSSQAEVMLQAADTAVYQAFDAVLAAEQAGSNVTGLLTQLDASVDLLVQAKTAYRVGDFDSALSSADQVRFIAQEVEVAASIKEQAALVSSRNNLWFIVLFSTVGNVVFILTLFFVWRWFKRRYADKLNTETKVVSNKAK